MADVEKRENAIRGLERFIDDFKPFCGNRNDWQRVYDALALLKEQEPKAKPQFDDDALDRNTYIKVGDLIDCMTELLMPEDAAFYLVGAIEWACGKRAVALPEEQSPRVMSLVELRAIEIPWERNTPPYFWMESRVGGGSCWRRWPDIHYAMTWQKNYGELTYGSEWRVWNLKPTPEQMEETPWEEVRRET